MFVAPNIARAGVGQSRGAFVSFFLSLRAQACSLFFLLLL